MKTVQTKKINNISVLKIVLKKSLIGWTQSQKSAAHALGLKRVGQVVHLDSVTPVHLGQIRKIQHLISVENKE